MNLKDLEDAVPFLERTRQLGVCEVRLEGRAAYVFVQTGTNELKLAQIRVLASEAWPHRKIVAAIRLPWRESMAGIAGDATEQ